MKVGLVLGGAAPSAEELAMLGTCGAVIAADSGAWPLLRAGARITRIVGDMDSLGEDGLALAAKAHIPLERHPPAKDETDGEHALAAALALRPRELLIVGGHGRRSVMFVANLGLLRRAHEAGVEAVMVGQGETLRCRSAGQALDLGGLRGATLSVLPLGGAALYHVRGTAFDGAIDLTATSARGVSNRVIADDATLRVERGLVLVAVEAAGAGAWLRPDDPPGTVYEFFAPFAHVPGKYEWCRIRSPTHGILDCFILLGASTSEPATVYVNSDAGARFMRERYPECATHRVPVYDLHLGESDDGRVLDARLAAKAGPVREASMRLAALPGAVVRDVPYGGTGQPVWGGRFTCWGVDLNLEARADGFVHFADGRRDELRAAPAIVTQGSFARIAPRPTP